MTVFLTEEKVNSLVESCRELLQKSQPSVRQGAQAIGKIVSSFPAVKYRPLHYRSLEEDKKEALRVNKGDYDKPMILSSDSKAELV